MRMKCFLAKLLASLAPFAAASPAQTLSAPTAAVVQDDAGRFLAIPGVLNTFLPGKPLALPSGFSAAEVVSASFAGDRVLVKLDTYLLELDFTGAVLSRMDAPPGPALFAFDPAGALAWLYFPSARLLKNNDGAKSLTLDASSAAIVAFGIARGDSLPALAETAGHLESEQISLTTGAVSGQASLRGDAPAAYFQGGWLSTVPGGLAWQAIDSAATRDVALPQPVVTLQVSPPKLAAVNGRWLINSDWQKLEIPARVRARELSGVEPIGGRR